jgi:hypothetical protein
MNALQVCRKNELVHGFLPTGPAGRPADLRASMNANETAFAFWCMLALGCLCVPIEVRGAPFAAAGESGADVVALPEPVAAADTEKRNPSQAGKRSEADVETMQGGSPRALRAPSPDELDAAGPAATITPLEVQCRAARASSLGNLLNAEQASATASRHACRGGDHASCVRRNMLGLAAQEARNRDAGNALLLYWSLAEAIHSRPIMNDAIFTAELAVEDHAKLTERGLEIPVDRKALLTRRLALEDGRVSLESTVDMLAEAIERAADLPRCGIATVRPGADEGSLDQALDADALVAEAMAARPELRMLRMLQANLDEDTVSVARTALAMVSPALGVGGCEKQCGRVLRCLHARENQRRETATVARQLRQLRHDREAAVADEVRRAARECVGNADRVRVARDQLAIHEGDLADLEKKLPSGGSDVFSIHAAELEVASARRAVIERLAAWERSRVTLWQAQGILVRQCGHDGH